MAAPGRLSFEQLSRRHGIKIAPVMRCSVEECSLAVGKVAGYDSILSASRMNSAFVIFLNSIEKVNNVVQSGIVIQDTFTPVMPLVQPARKILLSNVPPFIKDELLTTELSRHGKIVSQMKKISLNCKSPLLKHVVCFRRQVYMILRNDAEDLNVAFRFRMDGFDYLVFATSEPLKCFECGQEGHIRRSCPERVDVSDSEPDNERIEATDRSTVDNGRTDVIGNVAINDAEGRIDAQEQVVEDAKSITMDEVVGVAGPLNIESEGNRKDAKSGEVAVAESILEGMDTEQVSDEALFKTPTTKRKRSKPCAVKGTTEQAADIQLDDTECSTVEDSDSDAADIKNRRNQRSAYNFDKIRSFLQKTKNMKNVQIVDYFPERRMFLESAVALMRGEGKEQFTAQEIYRLKKFVSKMRLELQAEDGFETA